MNSRAWLALLGIALMSFASGCPKKSEPKILTLKPRAEVAADRDALVVTGSAAAPADKPRGQARLMAERAAKLDALRQLAAVVGEMQVQAIPGGRQINIEGFVQGAQQLSASFDATNGMAQVTLQLPLNGPTGLATVLGYDRAVVETVVK
jgi:hypothetical protein